MLCVVTVQTLRQLLSPCLGFRRARFALFLCSEFLDALHGNREFQLSLSFRKAIYGKWRNGDIPITGAPADVTTKQTRHESQFCKA